MRTIPGQDGLTEIEIMDQPGEGGASHVYEIQSTFDPDDPPITACRMFAKINFQQGPIREAGLNGCFIEDLLKIVIDRLECFQKGLFRCDENDWALSICYDALRCLDHRTEDRKQRGVEGKSIA